MALQVDSWIRKMAIDRNMISPFVDKTVEDGVISYGLSSSGYDVRLGTIFYRLKQGNTIIDPKYNNEYDWDVVVTNSPFILHPNEYVLGHSIETFSLPDDVMVLVVGKSTYARVGLLVNVTPGEPGWTGQWTLEFSNPTKRPIKLYPNEGIAQCIFFKSEQLCDVSYAAKKGKYQMQSGVTLSRVKSNA